MEGRECELCLNANATTTYETAIFTYNVCTYCKDLADFEDFDDEEDF